MAEVFVAAFPESVAHVAGTLRTTRGLQDMFALVLEAEPEAVQVAEEGGRVAGYVLSPTSTKRLRSVAWWRGYALRAAWRWLTGQYGVRWRGLITALEGKLAFWRNARVGVRCEARILSMAVHPDFQGRQLGKRLLEAGLAYLEGKQVPAIRLEVRPDNGPARHLYEQAGFEPVGSYADAQGPWLVMIKRTGAGTCRRGKRRWILWGLLLLAAASSVSTFLANRPFYLANLLLRAQMQFLPVPDPGQRVLIMAPHPDDETLGCGGLVQQAMGAGAQVYVGLLTQGDASDYAVWYYERGVLRRPEEYLALGRTRERETRAALRVLGVPQDHLFTFGYPNEGLEKLWEPEWWLPGTPWTSRRTQLAANPYEGTVSPGAAYCGSNLLADLHLVLERVKPDLIMVTAPMDAHPDHWAAYDFVRLALEQLELRGERRRPRLYGYLVHRRDWPAPVGYRPQTLLKPPADHVDRRGVEWWALPLEEEEVARKTRALAMYRSQAPQLDRVLLSFLRHNELFCEVAPEPYGRSQVILTEPTRDQPALKRHPGGDIAALRMRASPAGATATLSMAGRLDTRLTYSLLGHSPQARGPVVWQATVRSGRGSLSWVEEGVLHSRPLAVAEGEGEMTFVLPAELVYGRVLLIEAYTLWGRRYLDHTTTRVVRLGPGED